MEYNLQKSIQPQLMMFPHSTYPRLTPYPANNFVQPGLSNVSKPDSFYVPLHTQSYKHEIKKNGEKLILETEQLGAGEQNFDNHSDSDDSVLEKLNEKKRKMLGDSVFDSFMHPKPFKTKKIQLEEKEKIGKGSKSHHKKSNHKFQFY